LVPKCDDLSSSVSPFETELLPKKLTTSARRGVFEPVQKRNTGTVSRIFKEKHCLISQYPVKALFLIGQVL
jgi:hypothetical protein